jgi:hypothetical protein
MLLLEARATSERPFATLVNIAALIVSAAGFIGVLWFGAAASRRYCGRTRRENSSAVILSQRLQRFLRPIGFSRAAYGQLTPATPRTACL